jgi:cytochrome c oxidase cbb3-type subunit 3
MTTASADPSEGAAEAGHPDRVDHGRVLDHEYDGIKEYDNPLPRWWVLIFWGSFWFSLVYVLHYHVFQKGESVAAAYQSEMVAAREARLAQAAKEKVSEEGLAQLAQDPLLVADAKLLFTARCATCHGPQGEGLIGPNLTDGFFLHDQSTLLKVYQLIAHGVPQKGMPAWEKQLSPVELRKLTAFVASLGGKNLPGKAPEGNPATP